MRSLRLLPALATVLFIQLNACAQSADVQEKIQQVEKNLAGNVEWRKVERPWTIAEQMTKYNTKGVSVWLWFTIIRLNGQKVMVGPMRVWKYLLLLQQFFQAASISNRWTPLGFLSWCRIKKIDSYADINNLFGHLEISIRFTIEKQEKISTANSRSHTAGLTVHGFGG